MYEGPYYSAQKQANFESDQGINWSSSSKPSITRIMFLASDSPPLPLQVGAGNYPDIGPGPSPRNMHGAVFSGCAPCNKDKKPAL